MLSRQLVAYRMRSDEPAVPPAEHMRLYPRSTKRWFMQDEDGVERLVLATGEFDLMNNAKAYLNLDAPVDFDAESSLLNLRDSRPYVAQGYGERQALNVFNDSQGKVQENINLGGFVTGASNTNPVRITMPFRTFSALTTNLSNVVLAAFGAFSQEDAGAVITGTGIPGSTTISTVSEDGTTATISNNATAGAVVTVTVNDHGLKDNDVVAHEGLIGNTAPNNKWRKIIRVSRTQYDIVGVAGNGTWTSGGRMWHNKSPLLLRIDSVNGSLGTAGGFHVAVGVRGRSGHDFSAPGISVWITPRYDCHGIVLANPYTTDWSQTPLGSYIMMQDLRGASGSRVLWDFQPDGKLVARPQEGKAGTADWVKLRNTGDTADNLLITVQGDVIGAGVLRGGSGTAAQCQVGASLNASIPGITFGTGGDTFLYKTAAGRIGVFSHFEFFEITAPPNAPVNGAYVFCRDNGAGKTQICAIFNTGAIQVMATQP